MVGGSHSFNPLDRTALGRSLEQALLRTPCELLPPTIPLGGTGLYALYYHGGFPLCQPITRPDCETPICVGRAVPQGRGKDAWGMNRR